MTDLDPNSFRSLLNDTLCRFVSTSSPVNGVRAPRLADELRTRIGELDFVKGPYVEMLPDFEKGRSMAQLCADGILEPAWQRMETGAPSVWMRPMHAHQEAALLRDENFLVATGNGLGKDRKLSLSAHQLDTRAAGPGKTRRESHPGLPAQRPGQ